MSLKGILKYGLYGFIGIWMFVLGIMVGRGSAPVTFDTQGFQERLESIAREFGKPKTRPEKIDLDYYDALSEPAKPEALDVPKPDRAKPLKVRSDETAVKKEDPLKKITETPGPIPVKVSKKAATKTASLSKSTGSSGSKSGTGSGVTAATVKKSVKKSSDKTVSKTQNQEKTPVSNVKARYTIQVAAYKSFKDAVTQMTILEKKGFSAIRTTKKIDGVTWYRVRVGAFATRSEATRFVTKLNNAGINGMIIKKD